MTISKVAPRSAFETAASRVTFGLGVPPKQALGNPLCHLGGVGYRTEVRIACSDSPTTGHHRRRAGNGFKGMPNQDGRIVRVIDVPGLGCDGAVIETATETIVLLDPWMSCEDRMDCMNQVLDEREQRLAG